MSITYVVIVTDVKGNKNQYVFNDAYWANQVAQEKRQQGYKVEVKTQSR